MTDRDRSTDATQISSPATTRIFIVDDHELLRDGLTELLGNRKNLEVCGEAAGEDEALEGVRELRPHLVIVDVSLQQGDGIHLVKRIKEFDSSIQVIVCSMHDGELYAERSFRAGASGYVPKQAPASEMLDAVAQVSAGGSYISPLLSQQADAGETGASMTRIDTLAKRELEVFTLIGQGLMNAEIADQLGLSPRTIDTYRERIKSKLELKSASELNRRAIKWVLLNE